MANDQTSQPQQSNQNNVNILVVSTDLSLAKIIQTACQTVAGENSDKNYRVVPVANKEKWVEALEKQTFHSVLIEEESLADTTAELFFPTFRDLVRKRPENKDTAIVLVTSKTNSLMARKLVRLGYTDVLIKPLDRSIFLQKMNMYNTAVPFLRESLLFNMDMKKEIDVAFNFESSSISEYGVIITTDRPIDKGLVVGLTAPFLEIGFSAVVIECEKVADKYKVQFMFVGLTPAETQAIRKLIRTQYADEKAAA